MTETEDTPKVIVEGVKPWDGEYLLDVRRAFTTKDWNIIKRVSGYLPYTIDDGLRGGDPELYVALAVIAMVRAQKVDREDALRVADQLAEAPFDRATIRMVFPKVEDDAGPPDLTSAPDEPSENGTRSSNKLSGEPSKTSSDPSETTPVSTGTIESELPSTLVRTGSAT